MTGQKKNITAKYIPSLHSTVSIVIFPFVFVGSLAQSDVLQVLDYCSMDFQEYRNVVIGL